MYDIMVFSERQKNFATYRFYTKNLNKMPIQEFADKNDLVKVLYNKERELGFVKTNNICENFIWIIADSFKITLSSCDRANK